MRKRTGVPKGVGRAAIGVAAIRQRESQRPDRLFEDPYAAAFTAAAAGGFADHDVVSGGPSELAVVFADHAVIRTRFFDDYLVSAAEDGSRQVVLLAAGLDTRAFRLSWPEGTRLFELDRPDVLSFKQAVLDEQGAVPQCERTALPADLCDPDWIAELVAAGFDRTTPTAWLIEGLLLYLTPEEAAALLATVSEMSASTSHLALEHGAIADTALMSAAEADPAMHEDTILWKGGLAAGALNRLTHHGWDVQTHDRTQLAVSYRRSTPAHATGGFITAIRR
ncbi:MAG: SAM-dependent methyltransferase [Actinomycetota bacterium]